MTAENKIDARRAMVLSYLKVARSEYAPRDTFDAFFPFIITAADPDAGAEYRPYEIAASLRNSLGWSVGGDFVELFTASLEKRGYVTPPGRERTRYWTDKGVRPPDTSVDADIDHLKNSFHNFTTDLTGILLHNVAAEDRLHHLADALVSNRLFTNDALQEYAERGADQQPIDAPEGSALSGPDFEYICARYIQESHASDPRAFNALVSLANIGVVTQLANFFHLRHDEIEKTGSPTIILDGPFLIDYIGLNGDIRRSDAALIVDAARERGCAIWAFRHSVEEAYDIVRAVVHNEPTERFGPLAAALRSRDVRMEELQAFIDDSFGLIQRMGAIDRIFDIKYKGNRWEEDDFRDGDWQSVYAKLNGWSDRARTRDCDSILGVMRLRALHTTRNPWDSRFFLLTSNAALARLAAIACRDQDLLREGDIGPAISRHEFAAILWLAGTPERRPAFVTAHLLAAAQGMVARDRRLIEKVQEYSTNLTSGRKEMVDAIISTEFSYEMLRDVTLSNPERLSDASFDRVIESLVSQGRQAGVEDARTEIAEAHQRLRREAAEALAGKELAEAQVASASSRAEQESGRRAKAEESARRATALHEATELRRSELERIALGNLHAAEHARAVLSALLDGAEADWSRVAKRRHLWVGLIAILAALVVASLLAYLGWQLRQAAGLLTIAIIVLLTAVATVWNDYFKTKRAAFQSHWAQEWTRASLVQSKRRFERRLQLSPGFLVIDNADGAVRIANRDAVLEKLRAQGVERPE